MKPDYGERVTRWERRTEWPLATVAALFLASYAWPILDENLSPGWKAVCRFVDLAAWALFAADYIVRLVITQHRFHYWSRHLADLAVIALPILRPLRLLRLVLLLKVLNRRASDSLRGKIAIYVVGCTVLLLFTASLAVLDTERHAPGSNIHDFGTAVWWATTTITTVGYGDHFPITTEGRFVAVGLMVGGIALLGVVTASIASWLIERVAEETAVQTVTQSDISALTDRIAELQETVLRLRDDGRGLAD